MGNGHMSTTEASAGLAARALAFNMMQLPGQPMMMHMGTSYLVNDLAAEVIRMTALVAELTAANARLVVRDAEARWLLHGWQEIDDVGTNSNYPAIANGTRAWLAGGAE